MPMSPAICLFSRPCTTWTRIARSRGVSSSNRALSALRDSVVLAACAVSSEPHVYGVQKILIPERLRQELDGARLHRLHGHRNVSMSGDEDDRERHARRGKIALKFQPAPSRHSHVENQACRAIGRLGFRKLGNRRKRPGMQTGRPQESFERFAKLRVVVDDHNAGI